MPDFVTNYTFAVNKVTVPTVSQPAVGQISIISEFITARLQVRPAARWEPVLKNFDFPLKKPLHPTRVADSPFLQSRSHQPASVVIVIMAVGSVLITGSVPDCCSFCYLDVDLMAVEPATLAHLLPLLCLRLITRSSWWTTCTIRPRKH